ncbi:hypothetical protein T07_8712 [Trichinella nelsoni]|uniref:Uncharacterized protein n=1 Tax=Trichinella nelsoni TaxID=6336 RepID=A0A0V0S4R6_9BILA|nr:hypothetical protein T07_8712 [Trichinella nelsoni]
MDWILYLSQVQQNSHKIITSKCHAHHNQFHTYFTTCFCVVSKGSRFIFTTALLNSCQRSIQPDGQNMNVISIFEIVKYFAISNFAPVVNHVVNKADYLHLQKYAFEAKDVKYLN